jgi:hypothetical protein
MSDSPAVGAWIIRGDGFGAGGDSNSSFKSSFGFAADSGLGVSGFPEGETAGLGVGTISGSVAGSERSASGLSGCIGLSGTN